MLKMVDRDQMYLEGFEQQFGGKLRKDNRWVRLAEMFPWEAIEDMYAENFSKDKGAYGINSRIAFGALVIQAMQGLTDEETVKSISENPYMQYYLGLKEFCDEPLFDPSMMVHFRKRFPADFVNRVNELMFKQDAYREMSGEKTAALGKANKGKSKKVGSKAGKGKNKANDDDTGDDKPSRDSVDSGKDVCGDAAPATDGVTGGPEAGAAVSPTDLEPTTEASASAVFDKQATEAAPPANRGKLLLDATVAPADIRYPSDLSLLNEARGNMERIIDELWQYGGRNGHKTAYSRKKAKAGYLSIAKQKKPRVQKIRKEIGKQLEYLKKNIDSVGRLLLKAGLDVLPEKRLTRIMDICELYRQQSKMHADRSHSCEDRIVSLRQPHIRPIVRGKAGAPCEFGQKIAASVVGGYTFIEEQGYDNFNEGTRLIESAKRYRERFGFYPEAILADKLYRNRANLAWCKERGIRLSGPRLGRPKVSPTEQERNQLIVDGKERNMIEGRFGVSKRRFGLGLVMAYLPETGLTSAAMTVLCMNAAMKLRFLFAFFCVLTFSLRKRLSCQVFCMETVLCGVS